MTTYTVIGDNELELARTCIAAAEMSGALDRTAKLFGIPKTELSGALVEIIEQTPPGIYVDLPILGEAIRLIHQARDREIEWLPTAAELVREGGTMSRIELIMARMTVELREEHRTEIEP